MIVSKVPSHFVDCFVCNKIRIKYLNLSDNLNWVPEDLVSLKKYRRFILFIDQHLVNEEATEKTLSLFKYLLFVSGLNESFLLAARKPFKNEFSHEIEKFT